MSEETRRSFIKSSASKSLLATNATVLAGLINTPGVLWATAGGGGTSPGGTVNTGGTYEVIPNPDAPYSQIPSASSSPDYKLGSNSKLGGKIKISTSKGTTGSASVSVEAWVMGNSSSVGSSMGGGISLSCNPTTGDRTGGGGTHGSGAAGGGGAVSEARALSPYYNIAGTRVYPRIETTGTVTITDTGSIVSISVDLTVSYVEYTTSMFGGTRTVGDSFSISGGASLSIGIK